MTFQATISYGQKPNEAFLLHYGFVDTSYKADFYSADLLEHVQQQYNIPEERVAGLAQDEKLYKSVESVSVASPFVQKFDSLSSCFLVELPVYPGFVSTESLSADVMLSNGSVSQPVTQEQGQRWMTGYGLTAFTAHSLTVVSLLQSPVSFLPS